MLEKVYISCYSWDVDWLYDIIVANGGKNTEVYLENTDAGIEFLIDPENKEKLDKDIYDACAYPGYHVISTGEFTE